MDNTRDSYSSVGKAAILMNLEHQLRKSEEISVAEKALIYAQTADYYGLPLSMFKNPFVAEEDHPLRTDELQDAQERLESVKRHWRAESDKRRRIGIVILSTFVGTIAFGFLYWIYLSLTGGLRP